jgi:hypothetical protein
MGRELPAWVDDEESATRYVVRALHNDAIDLGRKRCRLESRQVADGDDALARSWDPRETSPYSEVERRFDLDDAVAELNRMIAEDASPCPNCRKDLAFGICLAVVEMLRGSEGIDDGTAGEPVQPRGGTTEWDQVLYEVLDRLMPSGVTRRDGRIDGRTRKVKQRCGVCCQQVLQLVLGGNRGALVSDGDPGGGEAIQ